MTSQDPFEEQAKPSAGSWKGKPLEHYEKDELISIIIRMDKIYKAALKVTSEATLERMSEI